MGSQAWSVSVEGRNRRIEIRHGYWFGKVTVLLDGAQVVSRRPIYQIAEQRGLDLPISLDGHRLTIEIRPVFWYRTLLVSGYRYGLRQDGVPVQGSDALPALVPRPHRPLPSITGWVENLAWVIGLASAVRLVADGDAVMAPVILLAPGLSSLTLRSSTTFSNRVRAALAVVAFLAGFVIALGIGQVLGLRPR